MFWLRFLLLFMTWCAFSGLFDPFHLGLGAMASAWVALISNHITFDQTHELGHKNRLVIAFQLGLYILWLLKEVFIANIQVLRLSLRPRVIEKLSPEVVEFRSNLSQDFSRFLLANSITLTPGTVTVRVDGDRFIVHALTKEMAEAVPGEMEKRLLSIFGGEEDA